MAPELKVITRGASSPQGKQKVFFYSYSSDFKKYFKVTVDEILARENVAIWYYEPSDYASVEFAMEELLFDISQMQLIVVPVSKDLLTNQDSVFAKIFAFVSEKNMPILPIVQENGLAQLFWDKFGDIQFLDKTNLDETAITYDIKLTKFLDRVILGDDVTEKIRESFEGYIFLSYRKLDRRYANELMKLIHQNDECRDIAIWYDELLRPGENFNTAIETALSKSDIFALVVTPNLLIKNNYVMKTEFPLAQKEGKSVVPVEFLETSRSELEENYTGIPACVKANKRDVAEAFAEQVIKFAQRDNHDSAEHKYYVGLAYLSGIDVEVDYHRAATLIFEAAEAGYEDAQRKLVQMFRNGEGLPSNDDAALTWQSLLMSNTLERYGATRKIEDGKVCLVEMLLLGDYAREMGDHELAAEAYEHVIEIADDIVQSAFGEYGKDMNQNPVLANILQSYAEGHEKYGSVLMILGKSDQAEDFYVKGMYIRDKFLSPENYEKPELAYDYLCVDYSQLGQLNMRQKKYNDALAYYAKAISMAEEHLPDTYMRKNLIISVCNSKIGEIYKLHKYMDEAKEHIEKSIQMTKELLSEYNSSELLINLAADYGEMGDIYLMEAQEKGLDSKTVLAKAKDFYLQQVGIYAELAKDKMTMRLYFLMSRGYVNLANICAMEGDREGCKAYHIKCSQCLEIRAEKTENALAYKELAESYMRVALFDMESTDEEYLEKACDTYCKIGQEHEYKKMLKEVMDAREKKK